MKTLTLLGIVAFLTLACVLGAIGALMLDLWDRTRERRAERRRRREELKQIVRR